MSIEVDEFIGRILTALGLGLAIGVERQLGQHPAGVRTNALVCLGSALFVSLSQVIVEKESVLRVAAQVVSGIGFLGGGVILREGATVRGLNTAATLWCSAAIGSLAGAGALLFALVGTIAIVLAHLLFRPIAHLIDHYTQGRGETEILCKVKIVCERAREEAVRSILFEGLKKATLRLQGLALRECEDADCVELVVHLFAVRHNDETMNDLVSFLSTQQGVASVRWDKTQ